MGQYSWRSQNSFAGGVISEKMFGRVELEQYQDSVSIMLNNKVLPHGGFTRRSGTKYGWQCKSATDTTRVIPFEFSADDSYVLEFGPLYIRFGRNGSQITSGGSPIEIATEYADEEIMQLKFVQSADVMWIVHRNHPPVKLLRYSDTEWYLDPVVFIDGPYLPVNTTAVTLTPLAATGQGVAVAASLLLNIDSIQVINLSSSPDYIYVVTPTAHGLTAGQSVEISGAAAAGLTGVDGTQTVTEATTATMFLFRVPDGSTSGTYNPVPTPATVDAGIIFSSTDVGRHLRIWNDTDAKWAWGEIVSFVDSLNVTVDIIENNFPTAATIEWKLGKWSETTGWPGAVMLYEQRIVYGASPLALQDVDFSQTNQFNFFQSAADEALLATDALSWSLFSQSVDNVAWMQPGRGGLAIGTSGGCWIMTGAGGKDDPLTPSSINAKKHEAIGVDQYVMPTSIDNAVIFVDKAGRRVHEFAYLWEDDTYRAPDLTLLSDSLTRATRITDMDVQKTSKIVWLTLENGGLIGLTYMRAESVVAWHSHQAAIDGSGLPGQYKSVCAVTEGKEEVPYFVVKRNINGVDVQYIEYLETDFDGVDIAECFYLDAGVAGAMPVDGVTVGGLDHLEGESVYVLAGGRVVKNLTVSAGEVTLPYAVTAGTTFQAGLNFFSDVESLPLEQVNDQRGSTVGRLKDLGKLALRVTDSYGAKIGRTFDTLEEIKFNENLIMGVAPELFSGEKTKDKIEGQPATDVRICIRQDIPLPLTVNSLVCHYEVTEE